MLKLNILIQPSMAPGEGFKFSVNETCNNYYYGYDCYFNGGIRWKRPKQEAENISSR